MADLSELVRRFNDVARPFDSNFAAAVKQHYAEAMRIAYDALRMLGAEMAGGNLYVPADHRDTSKRASHSV